jgi:hypothetical protein
MKRLVSGTLAALFLTSAPAGTLVCGTRVISEGSSSAEVLARCGEPAQIDRSSVLHGFTTPDTAPSGVLIEVHVEVWLYNFGPDKLMQRIRFEDGTVVRIESLGYGFVKPEE